MPGIYRHVPPNARFWPFFAGRYGQKSAKCSRS